MLHHPDAPGMASFTAEEAAEFPEDAAEIGAFASHHVVDHAVIGLWNLGFHETDHGLDDVVGHFSAEAEGDEFFFEFVHVIGGGEIFLGEAHAHEHTKKSPQSRSPLVFQGSQPRPA
jgi:hypothetical protein